MRLNQFPSKDEFVQFAHTHNVIPVCEEVLADTETPVTVLKKLYAKAGPVFLFESVEGGERWGRYSFLGASAHIQVRVFKNHVEVQENGSIRKIDHFQDPLAVLKELMSKYVPLTLKQLPRFWGGLVGYLTYEMVSFFEKVPNELPEAVPMAHFMIPDEVIIFDNIKNTLTAVVITYMDEPEDAPTVYAAARERLAGLLRKIEAPLPVEPETTDTVYAIRPKIDPDTYRSGIRKVKEYIRQGEIIQSVISQPFVCENVPDAWMLYRSQRYVNPSPYLYFLHMGDTVLVGSSPETMVRMENRVATLRPIAGTRPRGTTEQEDRRLADELLKDEKERAEHLMLVDLGRNDLGRVAETGTVQVTDLMFVERYSHVMHLVSNITCDLKPEHDAWDLIRATFPAGTLSGAPKVRAMEIIAEMESEPRGPYGGAVGYVSFTGNMDLAITIRTACIQNNLLTVRAGGGIVADSDPETERVETINKSKAILKALSLLQNPDRPKED